MGKTSQLPLVEPTPRPASVLEARIVRCLDRVRRFRAAGCESSARLEQRLLDGLLDEWAVQHRCNGSGGSSH